jgi:hypothetical protein
MRLGLNDLYVLPFFLVYCVPLRRDAVPVQLAALSLFIPVQFMHLEDGPLQIVGIDW